MATKTAVGAADTPESLADECASIAGIMMSALLDKPIHSRSGLRYFTEAQAFELTKIFINVSLHEAGLIS